MLLTVPFLRYEEIGEKAYEFLIAHHPTLEPPIPIEQIIEFDLGLDIIPFPNLYKDHGINGFLSSDLKQIYVDQTQFEVYTEKYRFTLAHEVGHLILHRDCYDEITWNSIDEYKETIMKIDTYDLGWFETHSDWFAEQVLLPRQQLVNKTTETVRKYKDEIIKITSEPDEIIPYISREISLPFSVSPPVVECRLKRRDMTEVVKKILNPES